MLTTIVVIVGAVGFGASVWAWRRYRAELPPVAEPVEVPVAVLALKKPKKKVVAKKVVVAVVKKRKPGSK